MENSSRLVITGGAGFLGSHLSQRLINEGHHVLCVDNFITGTPDNYREFADHERFGLLEQDVSQYIDVEGEVQWVVHFASPASPVDYLRYPIQTLKVGALGTHNALGLAKAKEANFLLASTSETYGDPLVHPQSELYWGNVNPIGPRGVYDEAKRFAEAMTMAYHRTHEISTRIVRIFNTYGPRMRREDGRAVPTFIDQALHGLPLSVYGDGSQTRSFCYVDDLIDGIVRLMAVDTSDPVNIGNPHEMTVLDLARLIIELCESHSTVENKPLPQDDPKVRQPDIGRARELLGWEPQTELRDGLMRTIEDFRRRSQAEMSTRHTDLVSDG